MGKLTAFFASGLVFILFAYMSTVIGNFQLGFEIPLFGWVEIVTPFEELQQPIFIIGSILAVLVFVLLLRGNREAKT